MMIMHSEKNKYLNFTSFKDLVLWSAAGIISQGIKYNKKYKLVPISLLLRKSFQTIFLEDDVIYTRLTIKTNNGGIVLRDQKKGSNIGTKKQKVVRSGQFVISKIDARNGAFGIIPEELDGAIVTNDFPVFDINETIINPVFLLLITTTKAFIQFAQSCSSGTTNRQRIDIYQFLSLKIPLPPMEEQKAIVVAYKNSISSAEQNEQKAEQIKRTIETYLLEELGLNTTLTTQEHVKSNYKYLYFVNMKEMSDRWDTYNVANSVFNVLGHAKYPIVSLGNTYDFITRTWNKKGETFRYVELGDVSPLFGITNAQTLETKKAPSRATQTIHAKDLIIGTTRPNLKRFAIVADEYANNVCSSGFQVIAPDTRYNLQFLFEFLMTEVATKQFKYYMTGALYPAITNKDLRRIQIPLPPLDVQNEIVTHIIEQKKLAKQLKLEAQQMRENALKEFENSIFG